MALVPLMNALQDYMKRYNEYEEYRNLPLEEKKNVEKVYHPQFDIDITHESLIRMNLVLSSLGFEAAP